MENRYRQHFHNYSIPEKTMTNNKEQRPIISGHSIDNEANNQMAETLFTSEQIIEIAGLPESNATKICYCRQRKSPQQAP